MLLPLAKDLSGPYRYFLCYPPTRLTMSYPIPPLGQTELHDVLNYAPIGVLVEDCSGRVVWLNHTLEWQLGVNVASMLGAHTSELPLEPLPGARGKRLFKAPYAYGINSARHLKCIEDILPEYSDTGIRVRYFLETREERPPEFRNDLMRLLENRSNVDSTIGVRDQDGIIQTLRSEVSRSRRYGNPLSVVVARIIPQPQTGQVLDHPSKTLSVAASLFKNGTRWADTVGRYGDWEFLLVLPETTAPASAQLVRNIEEILGSTDKNLSALRFDIRFGVAEWHRGDDETSLLGRAQHAVVAAANTP